ncbi:unnamed protein product [Closterium sp. NIES-65]|nr:unnamed protein product [Closterium sp. NIES-65]
MISFFPFTASPAAPPIPTYHHPRPTIAPDVCLAAAPRSLPSTRTCIFRASLAPLSLVGSFSLHCLPYPSARPHTYPHSRPTLPPGVWLQDPDVYHMSIFHASHHLSPVPATAKQLVDEVRAVKGMSKRLCPMRVSLDRVTLTATGVLLACWQVVEGTDPAELRDAFKEALPRAPKQQLYNQVMLHTSLARIIAPPTWPDGVYMCAASTYPSFDSSQHLHHPCGRTGR